MIEEINNHNRMSRGINISDVWLSYVGELAGGQDEIRALTSLSYGPVALGSSPMRPSRSSQPHQGAGGTFDPSKLQNQLRRAYEYAGSQAGEMQALVKPAKVVFSPERLKEIASKVPGVDPKYVASRSPHSRWRQSDLILNSLYPPGEKVLVFTDFQSQGQVIFDTGASWNQPLPTQADEGVWFLINPVDGEYHPNPRQQNKPSRRSEESITNWRYLLLESDVADARNGCRAWFSSR